MEEVLCRRFSEEIRYVDSFLELLSLVDKIDSKDVVDQMLHKILTMCSDDTVFQYKQEIKKIDCLKLVLLSKFRLELKGKTKGIQLQDCRRIIRLCLLQSKDSCPLSNFDALEIVLWLLGNEDFIEIASDILQSFKICLGNYLMCGTCTYENIEITPLCILNLLEKTIAVFSKKHSSEVASNSEFLRLLNEDSLNDFLVELVLNDSGILSINVLTRLIPVIVEASPSILLLSKIWIKLTNTWKGDNWEEADFGQVYLVLSFLANYFFHTNSVTECRKPFILAKENKFWEIILFGIGQKNPTVRKQSRFLLRRALDFTLCNSSQMFIHVLPDLFCCNQDRFKDLSKFWNDYFLILEALEEKQVHLIEPLLIIFEKLISDHSSCIPTEWMLPVYQRMFSHDSNCIVKYGLHSFLSQHLGRFVSSKGKIISFLVYPFLQTLNNTYLYIKQEGNEFEIEHGLINMFSSLANGSNADCNSFFTEVLPRLCEIPWGPVPLFYFMKSLSSLSLEGKFWQGSSLKILKLFLTNTLQTHSVYIRGAIQCCTVKTMINFLNTENLEMFDLTDVIGAFCQDESLKRGFYSWTMLVDWLKKIFNNERAIKYMTTSLLQLSDPSVSTVYVNEKSLARMVVLLCDASFLLVSTEMSKLEMFQYLMLPILKHLESLDSRPYASDSLVGSAVHFLCSMIEECCPLPENDATSEVIIAAAIPFLESIICYIRKRLFHVKNVDDFHYIKMYLKALHTFSNEKEILLCLLKYSEGLVNDAFCAIELEKKFVLCRYFAFKIICLFGDLLVNNGYLFQERVALNYKNKLSLFVQHTLQGGLINQKYDEFHDSEDIHTYKGLITTEYIKSHWLMIYFDLKTNCKSEELILTIRNIDLLIEDAMESVEIGGKEVLLPVLNVFKVLLPQAMENSLHLAWKFCNFYWKATFEHRKSDFFWVLFKGFIHMVFQIKIMLMPQCEKNIIQLSEELLSQSQTVGRIFRIFVNHLYYETHKHGTSVWRKYYNLLVDALTYGPVLRKDQRIYKDTCEYIQSFGTEYTVNSVLSSDCFSDTSIRIKGLSILLLIVESERRNSIEAKGMTERLADCIWKKGFGISDAKSRYYGNSNMHRLKQRAMQSLLILETTLTKDKREQLLVSVCDSLSIESHQPSVKYLQEWLLVRILTHHPDFRSRMWEIFQQVGLKRPGCMGSFIAVMYHLTKTVPEEELEQFIMECLQHILPCCMAQQFSVRLYAQVVIQKLWELIVSNNFEMAIKEYKVAYNCLNSGFDQANNFQKNLKKLKENFYFRVFHPIEHFSIETIYYEIPRLANVSVEEWLPVSKFEDVESNSILPLQNSNHLLKLQSVGEWIAKSNEYSADPTMDRSATLQKKIMPWKLCFSQSDVECFMEESDNIGRRTYERSQNRDEGLIVVASLIDRMPNLGGLCRTCEAFNVSEYVLGSLKYTEDKQFQNLSVTAESWIPISEIKPFMLAPYLKSMKEEGYTVIGAEQTSNSKILNEFKFPKKSLLLLGNEKDGIPADLLPLLDVCVEVPQQGVIRSLNVHVTGAIFVWEYARQNTSNA